MVNIGNKYSDLQV